MTTYFHSDTLRYTRRMKYIITITMLPLFSGSVIAVLILLVNLRVFLLSGFLPFMLAVIAAAAFSTLLCLLVIVRTDRAVKRNARYSFFDIGERELVYSRYAGEYIRYGQRIIIRKLHVIPLSSLSSVNLNSKKGTLYLVSESGGIRSYTSRSERLGYHFIDGRLDFDNWWFNQNCYKTRAELVIPDIFGGAAELEASIREAKKLFDMKPAKKPYVHREPDFIKKKKALETIRKLNSR